MQDWVIYAKRMYRALTYGCEEEEDEQEENSKQVS